MVEIDFKFIPNSRQGSVGRIKQGVCGKVISRSEPFTFEYSPKCFRKIEMRTIWRKEEQEQPTFFPCRAKFPHEFASVDACVVKDYKGLLVDAERKPVEEVRDFVRGHVLDCRESLISVIAANHAENIESRPSPGRDMDILTAELPSVWHISLGADVTFITIIKVDETVFLLLYEFLQLLGLIRIELRRGLPLGTFPYTSISRAKADKKDLKVLSLAFLPEARCHASLAFLKLCLSFSMALRTASSSELSIIGLRPRPGRVLRPLIPSDSNRLSQKLTDTWVISVCTPTSSEVSPFDFNSITRQRIRNAWLLPWRKPSSSCRRCESVNCITLIFAIAVSLYGFGQRYAKVLI